MSDSPNEPGSKIPSAFKRWIKEARSRGVDLMRRGSSRWRGRITGGGEGFFGGIRRQVGEWGSAAQRKLRSPETWNPQDWTVYLGYFRWGLWVLTIFLLAELTARSVGLWIPAKRLPPVTVKAAKPKTAIPSQDYEAILSRNMFNVEGKIPDPFDQGQLDCFSQAKPSTLRIQLLGTIVMNDEKYSVALMLDESGQNKEAVRQGDALFDNRFQVMKVDRKRVCLQSRSTQELEFVEIPDGESELGGPSLSAGSATDGITPLSEDQYVVNQTFLEKNLLNLNEILQTARAVPYLEPGTGKFMGFLVQSMDDDSPFSKLGVRRGDILVGVNDIVLDNAGKGLEAFQRLRNSPKIELRYIRNGQTKSSSFDVKP